MMPSAASGRSGSAGRAGGEIGAEGRGRLPVAKAATVIERVAGELGRAEEVDSAGSSAWMISGFAAGGGSSFVSSSSLGREVGKKGTFFTGDGGAGCGG